MLEIAGGVWRFDAGKVGQRQADGIRFVTGLRNTMALAVEPSSGALYGAQHGRDLLKGNWPDRYTDEQKRREARRGAVAPRARRRLRLAILLLRSGVEAKGAGPEYGGDQAGFNLTFVPFKNGRASGDFTVFAEGFIGAGRQGGDALHRPTGLAVGPDGSLYVTDDRGGRTVPDHVSRAVD